MSKDSQNQHIMSNYKFVIVAVRFFLWLVESYDTLEWLFMSHHVQGDHLSGNVREVDSCQGHVRDFSKSQGNVSEKNLVREKLPKTVLICRQTYLLLCIVSDHALLHYYPHH